MSEVHHRSIVQKLRHTVGHSLLMLALAGPSLMGLSVPAHAQASTRPVVQNNTAQPAALLADTVQFTGTQLIATQNVAVHYGTARLTAQRIVYDRATGSLTIDGPIHLAQNGGNTVILASAAELSSDLRDGILTSARMVIDQQFQLAAASMERVDGRYTRLARTVSSACKVCAGGVAPLWQIRAKEVIHDSETRQLYFTDAQMRLWDVPVFFLPRLRLPDPTLKRATGFLKPVLRDSSPLGTGIQIPYFIALGDHRDLTLSPYISSSVRSVDLQYRQAFRSGTLKINGAVSSDGTDNGLRGYIFSKGSWDIGNDLKFGIDLRATSDISYLLDYDVYDRDRLQSRIWLERYQDQAAFDAQLIHIRTLRESEVAIQDSLPFLLGDTSYTRFYTPNTLGGTAWMTLSATGSYRTSTTDIDGMDVLRTSAEAGWKNSSIFGPGFRIDGQASSRLDAYAIWQNSDYNEKVTRFTPAAQLRLSYPLERTTPAGAQQTLTPIAQLSWAHSYGGAVPNSDSRLTEFDAGNFLALSQFSGHDRLGTGTRGTLGVNFTHHATRLSYGLTVGRILSAQNNTNYSVISGLSGVNSDVLIDAFAQLDGQLSIASRALFDNDLTPNKWETRLDLVRPRYSLGLEHSYVQANTAENRATDLSELNLDSTVKLADNWTAATDYRYDFEQSQAASAGFELEYANECARVTFGVTRRFTDTQSIDPTMNYSISVGFGSFGNQRPSATTTCGF